MQGGRIITDMYIRGRGKLRFDRDGYVAAA